MMNMRSSVSQCVWKLSCGPQSMKLAFSGLSLGTNLSVKMLNIRTMCRRLSTSALSVKYPPILDLSYTARKAREKEKWHEKIKALPTVEEKLIELNMPSYYGWKSYQLNEGSIPYDFLRFAQFITRTHMTECEDLPLAPAENQNDLENSAIVDELTPLLKGLLTFECSSRRFTGIESEGDKRASVMRQIIWLLMSSLPDHVPHLVDAQVDYNPRIEAFWAVGGMEPTYETWKARKNSHWQSSMADNPEDRFIQYKGCPILQVRHPHPLPPIVGLCDSEKPIPEIPHFKYDPRVLGLFVERRHGTNIPGFWPGDPCEFGLLSFHEGGHIHNRPEWYGAEEHAEALHAQAILASYGWLYPLACYQGFSTFNDVTYPFVTQTVITDGQFWSFYTYQLNTTLMHSNNSTDNARCNFCWGTRAMKLYEEIKDGEIIGFNEDVLKKLLKIFMNKSQPMVGEMKPYLSDYRYVANIPDVKKRTWLETRFKHLYSLRPRHRELPEVYHWEKIYKIDHSTRPMDARRRPFELEKNPYKKRLDEHQPAYVPKKLRENSREKWAKTYYP